MENDKSRMWKAIIATFVTVGCVVSACAADVFSPLPPGYASVDGWRGKRIQTWLPKALPAR